MFSLNGVSVKIADLKSLLSVVRIPLDRAMEMSLKLRSCSNLEFYSETDNISLTENYWKAMLLRAPNVCRISLKNVSIPYSALWSTIAATSGLEVRFEKVRLLKVNAVGHSDTHGYDVLIDKGILVFKPEMQETVRYQMLWNLIHCKFPPVHWTIFGDVWSAWISLGNKVSSETFTKNAMELLRRQTGFTGTTDAELALVDVEELKPAILFELSLYLKTEHGQC
jgi:hypothetical protein